MKVRSVKGEMLDVSRYLALNEETPALGNANMNARGDIIGKGGKIIKSRAEISEEYHATSKKAVKQVALSKLQDEVFQTPQEAVKELTNPRSKRKLSDGDE